MSEPVVVGTDGSAVSDRAVEWAAAEAMVRGRPLHIVHAVEPWPYAGSFYVVPEAVDSMRAAGQEVLTAAETLARKGRPDIEVTTELVQDETGPALRKASERGFELVLGHRGRGGFASLLLGSVGLQMAGHAAGPVVIVRGDTVSGRDEIVVGIDLVEDPAETLGYAFEAAAARGARLRVVHSWQLLDSYTIDAKEMEEKLRWAVVEAHAPWRKRYPDVGVDEEIVREHPVTALCDASRSADLVVVGAHGRRRFEAPRLGSVSHGVVHQAHCPVAIARTR